MTTTLIDLTEQLVEAEAANDENRAEWVALAISEHLGHDDWECLYGKDWAVTGLLVSGWRITRSPS